MAVVRGASRRDAGAARAPRPGGRQARRGRRPGARPRQRTRRAIPARRASRATLRSSSSSGRDNRAVRLYSDLAPWFHLLTAPEDYAAEAERYRAPDVEAVPDAHTLLELGSGGGNNASHLSEHFTCTLSDVSPQMLALSRTLNPSCEHVLGDMRTLRLGRTFDVVFVHDAIAYMATEDDLRDCIGTAHAHTRPGGVAVFVPDHTRETFAAEDVARRPRRRRRAVAALPRVDHRRRSRRHELRGRLRGRRPRARSGAARRPRSPRRGRLPRAHVAPPARARGVRAVGRPRHRRSRRRHARRPSSSPAGRASARQTGRSAARVASTSRPICSTSASSLSKRLLVAQPLPELDDEPLAVEVAVEVEQERLDPPLRAAVVRVRADRDCGAVPERLARRRSRSAGRRAAASIAMFAVG